MRLTTRLALAAVLLVACGRGGNGGDHPAGEGVREPGRSEARSGASGQEGAAAVPFGPRTAARRAQDSVLRSGSRHRPKVVTDTT